ncbi:MAG TPA: hypothetical protein VNV85_12855 [Puia sp.]|jgi:hypothetical protein|nr:hypothetical protein [Puia sp.]
MRAQYFLFLITVFSFITLANAQYKRRGETLQKRPSNSKGKKPDYSLLQLQGKWQEFERKDRKTNALVPFNDSVQLIFTDSNKVETRTSVETSMTLDGEADIDWDNTLTVAADVYTIKSLTGNTLVLDDNDRFIHRLRKTDSFWYEKLGKLSVKPEDFSTPIAVGINNILGKWFVYRRRAKPGATSRNAMLIKNLNIHAKSDEHTAAGDITFYQQLSSQELPCIVTLHGVDIKIVAGKNTWNLSVYQADANNFVFGTSSLLYYCKPTTPK